MRYRLTGLPNYLTAGGNPFLPEDPDPNAGGGGGKPNDDDKGGNSGYTPPATQEELNRIISDRLTRERSKFADYDDVKAKAQKLDELEEATASETDKKVKAAREEAATEERQRSNAVLIRAEARALAAEAKFRDPKDAVAFLDLGSIKVGDDGSVDSEALTAALKTLAADKPYLLADDKPIKPKPDATQGGRGGDQPATGVSAGRDMFASRRGSKTSTT